MFKCISLKAIAPSSVWPCLGVGQLELGREGATGGTVDGEESHQGHEPQDENRLATSKAPPRQGLHGRAAWLSTGPAGGRGTNDGRAAETGADTGRDRSPRVSAAAGVEDCTNDT